MNLSLTMNDGRSIPQLGFGTCRIAPETTAAAVTTALEAGYRHIDTATIYKNEAGVGQAVAESGLPRAELFVTTKLWNTDQGYDTAIEAAERSLELLGLDYLDLYLIHWAQPGLGRYRTSWEALVELRERGLVRSIGVSNFTDTQLDQIISDTGVTPAVNQIELHPYLTQTRMRAANLARGALTEAWSPLGNGLVLNDPTLKKLADNRGIGVAELVLAWHLAAGNVVIPKTETPARMASNLAVQGTELTPDEIAAIEALERRHRLGGDPAEGDLGAPEYSDRRSFTPTEQARG
ncbi:aldo/keto reductase [Rothia nasimurium]|uniref:aldo/keto reductase n=1 Tax=Rothia nasimurium TaxID=85336 RepID=UPI002DD62BB5|nr:aldo/keto reductase [Rothia nasimurium]